MSVDITIEDNRSFVDQYLPHLIQVESVECGCTDADMGIPPDPRCPFCMGAGGYPFAHYPFEMNIASAAFGDLWRSFGWEPKPYGEIPPTYILQALQTPKEFIERGPSHGIGAKGARWFEMGYSPDRIARWFAQLESIAQEALRRGKDVVWAG